MTLIDSALPSTNNESFLYAALILQQLFKARIWLAESETASEAYNKNGRQYTLSSSTVISSALASLL